MGGREGPEAEEGAGEVNLQHKRRKLSSGAREVTDRRGNKRRENTRAEEKEAEPEKKRARNRSASERRGIG